MVSVKEEKKRIDYLLERDNVTDKQLDAVYQEALAGLQEVIGDFYINYSVDGTLNSVDLSRKVTRKDLELLRRQYAKLPDDMEIPESKRADVYVAQGNINLSGLLAGMIGLVMLAAALRSKKIVQRNRKTAVREEISYQSKNMGNLSKNKKRRFKRENKALSEPNYKPNGDVSYIPWQDRLLANSDQAVNRINIKVNKVINQGMTGQDVNGKLFPSSPTQSVNTNLRNEVTAIDYKLKRIARTEAARLEDEVTESRFKTEKVKWFDWVTEPGACKKCINLFYDGPYEVGAPDSPRIPDDSHPNCRCRRIPSDYVDDEDISSKALLAGMVSANSKSPKNEDSSDDEEFKFQTNEIKSAIIGLETSDGIMISNISKHLVERTIQRDRDVSTMIDALVNPLEISPTRYTDGKPSKRYCGAVTTVVINPDTGNVITTHPTRRNIRKRHGVYQDEDK